MNTYIPRVYWEARGRQYPFERDDFFDFPGKQEVASILSDLKPESLLDLGCGAGRLFPLYKDVPSVLGVDFSRSMLKHADEVREKFNLKNVKFRLGNALWLDMALKNEKFDMVLSRNFLMHVKPEDIENVVKRIREVVLKWVLLIEYFGSGESLSPHNFRHDYPALFLFMQLEYSKEVDGNTLFLFRVI